MKIKEYFQPEVNVFIKECQRVLKEKGKKISWYQMYEDEKIRIVQGMNSLDAFRIEILPKGHPQNLHNPVIGVDADGNLTRVHGEWVLIKGHVEGLLK
jgi:hypothetical protein